MRQIRRQRVGDSIHEIFLIGISGEVLKWQHGKRSDRRRGASRAERLPPSALVDEDQCRSRRGEYDRAGDPRTAGACARSRSPVRDRLRDLRRRRGLNLRDESVPAARQRFDEPRILSRIVERFAQLPNGVVHADVEIDEGVGRPEPLPKLFARHQFASALEQHTQNVKGLVRKPDLEALPAQLT